MAVNTILWFCRKHYLYFVANFFFANQRNLYPNFTMDSLINGNSKTWNLQAIRFSVDLKTLPEYGHTDSPLKAFCWKVYCPPKIKHILWQMVSECTAVKKILRARGIQGDTLCARCGAPEESI